MVWILASIHQPQTVSSRVQHQTSATPSVVVAVQSALTTQQQPKFPDMRANYEKYVQAKQSCDVQGGTLSGITCVVPAPAPAPVVSFVAPAPTSTNSAFAALRMCESTDNYQANTGNGFYGAYQYDLSTWANYGGYARPDLAPPAVQDAKAQETEAARGWEPWPACSARLGL